MSNDDQLAHDVAMIRRDVDSILHGNGRAGVRKIADAVFGHRDSPNEPGLMARVKRVEEHQREGDAARKEMRVLMRGVAIGLGVVMADSFGVVDLVLAFFR